ncbi:TonB C-terminal domain-containing protein [Gallaecimonas pentaromativorans]|uniref:TonB C-terminal domain-containing protein n=1 Tax=Gallaecimonas pentaromativorans TaxID=584787 RepID=UPI003A8CEA49
MKRILLPALLALAGCSEQPEPQACQGLAACAAQMQQRVVSHADWVCHPELAQYLVVVTVRLDRQGQALGLDVSHSSGNSMVDNQSLEAVQQSLPLYEVSSLSDADFAEASEINFTFAGLDR